MNKQEVATLLTMIQDFYPSNFFVQDASRMLELWYMDLKNEDSFKVKDNFDIHRKKSNKPPTIADLIKEQPKEQCFNIPSVEETKRYLISLEEPSANKISPEKKKLLDERLKAILSKDEMEW